VKAAQRIRSINFWIPPLSRIHCRHVTLWKLSKSEVK
jgi:hypothetical protein